MARRPWFVLPVIASLLGVFSLGTVLGTAPAEATTSPSVAPGPRGYWLVASDGGIFSYGGARFEGSAGAVPLAAPIVGMAATPDSAGYWLAASDGGVFTYGDARYAGSASALPGGQRPSTPIAGIAPSADGGGYWLAGARGGVYSFGDAGFFGSAATVPLAAPIVGMASTPDGAGYWLAGADGGVLTFGDAGFFGAAAGGRLGERIVGITATPDGGGYWLVGARGGVYSFGDAGFFGSAATVPLATPIVGMAATPDGGGYWLVAGDGGIFAFGDAPFRGSAGVLALHRPVVGLAVGRTLDPFLPASRGYDISFPECGAPYPSAPYAMGIVGINDGRAFTHNPCLPSELDWGAASLLSVYINLNAPPAGDTHGLSGPGGACPPGNTGCIAYNYGYNTALDAYAYATTHGANAAVWWLDIETTNTWDPNQYNNSRTIQGALDALGASGVVAGIYSTYLQFPEIAGAYAPGGPIWVPYSDPAHHPIDAYCTDPSLGFAGGTPWLVQYQTAGIPFDQDYACLL